MGIAQTEFNYLMRNGICILFGLFLVACSRPKVLKEGEITPVEPNSAFTVILPEDHSKGATWVLDQNFDENVCSHQNTVWHGKDKGGFFEFKALKPGEIKLRFLLRMYRDTLDNKTFSVKIQSS